MFFDHYISLISFLVVSNRIYFCVLKSITTISILSFARNQNRNYFEKPAAARFNNYWAENRENRNERRRVIECNRYATHRGMRTHVELSFVRTFSSEPVYKKVLTCSTTTSFPMGKVKKKKPFVRINFRRAYLCLGSSCVTRGITEVATARNGDGEKTARVI